MKSAYVVQGVPITSVSKWPRNASNPHKQTGALIVTSRAGVLAGIILISLISVQAWAHGLGLEIYGCHKDQRVNESGHRHAGATAVCIVQDRVYRQGVFLVVDAVVENVSPRRVDWAEVSVEFHNFFDELLSAEHTVLQPPTLGPGQRAVLRVATPFTEAVRKLRYRFTWRQAGEQLQSRPEEEQASWR